MVGVSAGDGSSHSAMFHVKHHFVFSNQDHYVINFQPFKEGGVFIVKDVDAVVSAAKS